MTVFVVDSIVNSKSLNNLEYSQDALEKCAKIVKFAGIYIPSYWFHTEYSVSEERRCELGAALTVSDNPLNHLNCSLLNEREEYCVM